MSEDLETTWNDIRDQLRARVTDFAFHIWLDPLELAGRSPDTLYVRAPLHVRSWVRERYAALLEDVSARVLGAPAQVELVGADWQHSGAAAPVVEAERRGLNPKYTFDQFVIGDGNRLAHAAALAVAELPAQAYNPLFIHGPPGLGKTHLLQAIGNYVHAFGAELRVHYATVESFTSEFVAALRGGDPVAFRDRFRGADVLLLDDVQFLAEKVRTKEELFHTFNALYESGRQLVITSDRSPSDLEDFEARLRERFQCGLVAELEPPGLEVRMAILRKRARHDGLESLPEEVIAEVARQVSSSVRALEGALVRVVAYASLVGEPPSAASARQVLSRLYRGNAPRCSVEEIQEATAEAYGVTIEDLLAYDRRPKVARARQVAIYLTRELTEHALPAIGKSFGGRNHATVLHAHRRIAGDLRSSEEIRRTVDSLREQLTRAS